MVTAAEADGGITLGVAWGLREEELSRELGVCHVD